MDQLRCGIDPSCAAKSKWDIIVQAQARLARHLLPEAVLLVHGEVAAEGVLQASRLVFVPLATAGL